MASNRKNTNPRANGKSARSLVADDVASKCAAIWKRRTGMVWTEENGHRLRAIVASHQERTRGIRPSVQERQARDIIERLREAHADARKFVEGLSDDEPDEPCSRYLWAWRSATDIVVTNRAKGEWMRTLDSKAAPLVTDAAFPHPPRKGADESARSILAFELTRKVLFPPFRKFEPTDLAMAYLLTFGIGDVPGPRLQEGAEGIIAAEIEAAKQAKARHGLGSRRVTRRR